MLLARRNLLRDRTRFLLSVLGVAVSVGLILLLAGYRYEVHRRPLSREWMPAESQMRDRERANAPRSSIDVHRVDESAAHLDPHVKMRAGGPAGGPDPRDRLAALDRFLPTSTSTLLLWL